tara:strand:- start:1157 stop:1351 length:195 start_codon:yes stop_codon:yes gene_type:complete
MKTYSRFIAEASEKEVSIGKTKALIKKVGNKFVATIDGEFFDNFKTAKEAETAIMQFSELMGIK